MAIVHRLLDAVFRTLDVVDLARERVDVFLGRSPRPEGAGDWDPLPVSPDRGADAPPHEGAADDGRRPERRSAKATKADPAQKPKREPPKPSAPTKPNVSPAARNKGKANGEKNATSTSAPKGGKASRKGSVDRKGAEVDSARARAVLTHLRQGDAGVLEESAAVEGRKVLARVLWALDAAEKSGSELGLTAADASALLHLAAGIEVFATNVARTCRDETHLIAESEPDGRSKRYVLTDQGRKVASSLPTRKL
jgi:hypothetical protein